MALALLAAATRSERLGKLRDRAGSVRWGPALWRARFPIDREALAQDLGFRQAIANSLDAVSDRDFAAEFLFVAAANRRASQPSGGRAESCSRPRSSASSNWPMPTPPASSLMPQKKNPDPPRTDAWQSRTSDRNTDGLLATLKALPSAYDKDSL